MLGNSWHLLEISKCMVIKGISDNNTSTQEISHTHTEHKKSTDITKALKTESKFNQNASVHIRKNKHIQFTMFEHELEWELG